MNYLSAENVSKTYGDQVLFADFTLSLNKGQKVGLIARNGTGKTSLLRILTGKDSSDLGGTMRWHKGIRIGYLEQDPALSPNDTIFEAVVSSEHPAFEALQGYENALALHTLHNNAASQQALEQAMNHVQTLEAWDFEARMREMLSRFGIDRLDRNVSQLSGGELKRVALASVLLKDPDLLVLDEPTNHLDLEMIEWLEEYLSRPNITLLIVTHDRYFLDRVTEEIIEIERGQMFRYKGNYTYYLEKKSEWSANFKAETDKAQKLMKKELEWIRTQPKARGTKAKARVDAFEHIEQRARQQIYESDVDFELVKMERIGGKTVEFHYVTKQFDDRYILHDFHYNFNRYDRIGIVGKNGTGKSTFLNLLTERERPDAGRVVVGQTVRFGYYTQGGLQLKEDKKVIDVVRNIAEVLPLEKGKYLTAAQLLYHFQFAHAKHEQYVSTLSGGEQRRLYLLTILMQNPNFLILDEPTNDLDLLTLNLLEEFLIHFKGCLVIVSHDRYFMDKLIDHVFVFEGNGKVRDYPGNYTQYREVRQAEIASEREKSRIEREAANKIILATTAAPNHNEREKRKLTFNEQREYNHIEDDIAALEHEKAQLETQLCQPNASHQELSDWAKRIGELAQQIETKTDRWLELSQWAQ
ncbi:MAG: ABC-F family ATP-binding cassette domain-containing protein [Sphingobacteriales bacterium]|nr:ABC-F family ATP-binding cassette domain-containing protein [Sphingobacteriales bacterium]